MTNEILNRVKMGVAKDIKNSGESVGRDEFVWGQYSREQSVSGVICVEGDLYVYTNNDFGGTTFRGPFDENEAIGYISTMIYIVDTSAKDFSMAELHQIRQTALHSYSAVLEQSQKKKEINSLLAELEEDDIVKTSGYQPTDSVPQNTGRRL